MVGESEDQSNFLSQRLEKTRYVLSKTLGVCLSRSVVPDPWQYHLEFAGSGICLSLSSGLSRCSHYLESLGKMNSCPYLFEVASFFLCILNNLTETVIPHSDQTGRK